MELEVRVGNFEGDFKTVVRKYNPRFYHFPDEDPNFEIYALIQSINFETLEPEIIMASLATSTPNNYNVTVTVYSEKIDKIRNIFLEFERRTGLNLREAPRQLISLQRNVLNAINSDLN
jgi:hypothetical protein